MAAGTGGSQSSGVGGHGGMAAGTGGATAVGGNNGTAGTGAGGSNTGSGGNGAAGNPGVGGVQGAVAFPLTASTNGRYLVDQNGVPFPILGDTSFTIISKPSLATATTYLNQRAAAGFNTIFVDLTTRNGTNAPRSALGDLPFTKAVGGGAYDGTKGTADFSTPNDAYFTYASQIIDLAAAHGMLVVLYALNWGYNGNSWWTDLIDTPNTQAVCLAYGMYLANGHGTFGGLKGKKNIIWIEGSDMGQSSSVKPTTEGEARALKIMQGLQMGGALQLQTGDWNATSISTDEPVFTPFMQVNGVYTYGGTYPSQVYDQHTYLASRLGYNFAPTVATQGPPGATAHPAAIPTFLKETSYEHSPFSPGDPTSVRKCEWWAFLSGCNAGLLYGDENVWPFVDGTWQSAMNDVSGQDMTRMNAFIRGIPWQLLVPSELAGTRRLVTSANGAQSPVSDTYVAAAISSDGKVLVAYAPPTGTGTQGLTVDLRSMAGNSRARWWNPTTAAYTDITGGAYSMANTNAAQSFTTPGANGGGSNDWILVVDTQ